ncbi:hypothetical protein PROVRETT_06031 [Providencia rettgeri DSM 1131]|nr:hypothetical protein PROVRETT_06031 [Providencia rettgeri DSM 1131]
MIIYPPCSYIHYNYNPEQKINNNILLQISINIEIFSPNLDLFEIKTTKNRLKVGFSFYGLFYFRGL